MDELKPSKGRVNSEMIVAVSAIVISVITAIVSGYQAVIMRDQQHVSVWPYIEWAGMIDENEGFTITVTNKGVGPALIKSSKMSLDGKVVNVKEYLEMLVPNLDTLSYSYSPFDNRVLGAGDELIIAGIYNKEVVKKLTLDVFARTKLDICFCDIYGTCWTSRGFTVVESECDN